MVGTGPPANSGWLQEGVIRGSMLGRTMLPTDEELGKKDDDHRYMPARRSKASFLGHTFRWRRKRMLLAVVGLLAVYWFFSSTPNTQSHSLDSSPLDRSPFSYIRPSVPSSYEDTMFKEEPTGPPPGTKAPRAGQLTPHTYDGEFRFYRLAKTLRGASHTDGYSKINRNVLFAMSSLKSASTLLPMVCEMATWNRNWVHAAFMGREDIPLQDLLDINGIDREKCPAIWHDARPDYSEYSTDERAELSVISAIGHISTFLHPQVAIMDDPILEDAFFVRGMWNKTDVLGMPVIEVPKDRWENYMWITRLDAGSLKSWHLPTVDVLIQVPADSSSVVNLLNSIKGADYRGLKLPRITLELPAEMDTSLERHLKNFQWPAHGQQSPARNELTFRRRIANVRATQEDAAIRFLELFYPTSTANSHVLLLSPQAQLSAQYFHYIKYLLLEYQYSSYAANDNDALMGVSLELPSVLLDGKTKLEPPTVKDMHFARYKEMYPASAGAPFLWQGPNSHATLIFGKKWVELHSFLSNRVSKHQKSPKSASRSKLVSETLPSWTEYELEFMRARGYSLLYPATTSSDAFVTIHNELFRVPEEYAAEPSQDAQKATPVTPPALDEAFLRAEQPPPVPTNPEPAVVPGSRPLHLVLPFKADLPELQHLPQLLYDGEKIDPSNTTKVADEYARKFRTEIGGCVVPKGKRRRVVVGSTRDLFCFGDEEGDDWEDDWTQQGKDVDGAGKVEAREAIEADDL
jgi:hypothetical protein